MIFICLQPLFTTSKVYLDNDQLPVGLLALLVERCTGIAEVMVQIPYGPEFFSGLISTTSSVVFITARIDSVFDNVTCYV